LSNVGYKNNEMQWKGRHMRAVAINGADQIIGAGRKAHTARISVAVDLNHRNKGIGTLLFKSLIAGSRFRFGIRILILIHPRG
jgi:GNAT superfamily N-acetyltransferase